MNQAHSLKRPCAFRGQRQEGDTLIQNHTFMKKPTTQTMSRFYSENSILFDIHAAALNVSHNKAFFHYTFY